MEGHTPHKLEGFPIYLVSTSEIVHYTCNAPREEVLEKHNITPIGYRFGCKDAREVLKIPKEVYQKAGFTNISDKFVLTLNLERLIRNLK